MNTLHRQIIALAKAAGYSGDGPLTVRGALDALADAVNGSDKAVPNDIAGAVASLDGLLYKTPTGTKSISSNGSNVDVSSYAKVSVSVPAYVVAFDANGGTGSVAPRACAKGSSVTLPDGTGLTAPEGKQFKGWGTTAGATATVTKVSATADTTVYAVWEDAPAG